MGKVVSPNGQGVIQKMLHFIPVKVKTFIATVTAIVGFVILVQKNFHLAVTIAVIVILYAILRGSFYLPQFGAN